MTCWACDRADKNRASGYYQAGCAACTARQLARMPRQHRMAAYVAERDKGGDVAALQQARSLPAGDVDDSTSKTYLLAWVLPNFYFHATTAYDILRHNGLEIGKKDFLGE